MRIIIVSKAEAKRQGLSQAEAAKRELFAARENLRTSDRSREAQERMSDAVLGWVDAHTRGTARTQIRII